MDRKQLKGYRQQVTGERYYYLNDDKGRLKYKGVRIQTLKADINRGVKFLNESAYHTMYGATRSSLRFFRYVSTLIDVKKSYRAKLTFVNGRQWYTLRVWTTDGYLMQFKGCSGGYGGEGTRGTYDILKACGFKPEQCEKAFRYDNFEVRKRVHLWEM